jgi:hypothetical protein
MSDNPFLIGTSGSSCLLPARICYLLERASGGMAHTVSMRFTDWSGTSWHRDWKGELREIPPIVSTNFGEAPSPYRVIEDR